MGNLTRDSIDSYMQTYAGLFDTAAKACDYGFGTYTEEGVPSDGFGTYTEEGVPPAGPIDDARVCMAYSDTGKHNMYCAAPPSAAKFIADKGRLPLQSATHGNYGRDHM